MRIIDGCNHDDGGVGVNLRAVLEEVCERQSALSTACVDKRKCWLTVKSAEYSLQALAETLVNNYSGNAM
jgi:hypothetical protein